MGLIRRKWIHWLTAAAVLLGSVAPSILQAKSVFDYGQGFSMEVCTPSGEKTNQVIDLNLPAEYVNTGECLYCLVQGENLLGNALDLQFAKPESRPIYSSRIHHTPRPYFTWMQLPSRAPPRIS